MSAILSADDLNDFISPGVACIKPVETLPKQENYNPYEVTTEDKVETSNPAPASISLTDCLACSGCVTSAEAVLVSLQSHTEVLNTLDAHPSYNLSHLSQPNGANGHAHTQSNAKVFAASVSPQVRASIAATYGITDRRAGNLITQFLSGSQGLRLGGIYGSAFDYVLDTNRLREACLVLGIDEVQTALEDKSKPRPILTSACPGWICYAEKTHPHVLPHLSGLKSPQALAGTLVKSVLSKALNIHPSRIWHLAIMPCFDKKLEASREELTDKSWYKNDEISPSSTAQAAVRDVDCVITSRELLTLATARGINLFSLPQTPIPRRQRAPFPDARLSRFLFSSRHLDIPTQSLESGTSGGYLYHILLTQQSLHPGSQIITTRGRNADVIEYTLLPDPSSTTSNKPILKCARYYGFRNIQNLVRKLKPSRISKMPGAASTVRAKLPSRLQQQQRQKGDENASEYAYVEVMACPGGCTNGGGQIKIEDVASIIPQTRGEALVVDITTTTTTTTNNNNSMTTAQSQKEWLARIDEAYYSASSSSDPESELDDLDNDDDDDNDDVTMKDSPYPSHTTTTTSINGINPSEVHDILSHWSRYVDVPLEKLAYTTFRKVESDVGKKGKNLGDSERIAAIAGMSGGGW